MLKLKDNVELKELEKFGFIMHYDENTGKLKKATKGRYQASGTRFEIYCLDKDINYPKHKNIFNFGYRNTIKKIDKRIFEKLSYTGCGGYEFLDDHFDERVDTIYDLIKADLVEKV